MNRSTNEARKSSVNPNEEFILRAKIVLEEYPFLKPIIHGLTTMVATEQEWVEAAEEVAKGPLPVVNDPDFVNKYKFIMTAAIVDNPTIPEGLKRDLLGMSFGSIISGQARSK